MPIAQLVDAGDRRLRAPRRSSGSRAGARRCSCGSPLRRRRPRWPKQREQAVGEASGRCGHGGAFRSRAPGGEPALERGEAIDESQAAVAKFPDGAGRRQKAQQAVGHSPIAQVGAARSPHSGAAGARRRAAARARARRSPRQRRDVGQAQVQALAGERVHHVRSVAEQHPAGPAPGRAPPTQRPGGALGSERSSPASPAVACISSASNAAGVERRAAPRPRPLGSDQTSAYERPAAGASNGSRASTSGERNHWRATPWCGRDAVSRAAIACWP